MASANIVDYVRNWRVIDVLTTNYQNTTYFEIVVGEIQTNIVERNSNKLIYSLEGLEEESDFL